MEKILVSSCLLGDKTRYDGGSSLSPKMAELAKKYDLVPFCPEQEAGLPTPRDPAEISHNEVVTKAGKNLTKEYNGAAETALRICRFLGIRIAILKDGSPACGPRHIHNGNFDGGMIDGLGVTARYLIANGIKVYAETDELSFLLTDKVHKAKTELPPDKYVAYRPRTPRSFDSHEHRGFGEHRDYHKSYGDHSSSYSHDGFKKPYGDHSDYHKSYGEHSSYHHDDYHKSYGDHSDFHKPYGDHSSYSHDGYKKPYGEHSSYHHDDYHKSYGDHSDFHKPYGDHSSYSHDGYKKSYGEHKDYHKSYEGGSSYKKPYGEHKDYHKSYGEHSDYKKPYGEHKSYDHKDGGHGYGHSSYHKDGFKKSYGHKDFHKKPYSSSNTSTSSPKPDKK